jgi:hypothetical protein
VQEAQGGESGIDLAGQGGAGLPLKGLGTVGESGAPYQVAALQLPVDRAIVRGLPGQFDAELLDVVALVEQGTPVITTAAGHGVLPRTWRSRARTGTTGPTMICPQHGNFSPWSCSSPTATGTIHRHPGQDDAGGRRARARTGRTTALRVLSGLRSASGAGG